MGRLSSFLKKTLNYISPKQRKPDFTSAVIVAGGSSTRMGAGISKQLLEIDKIPVVVRTLLAFEETPEIDEIIVVAKESELELYKEFKTKYKISKLKQAVIGGCSRQESVKNGFELISDKSKYVAIHDGARCLITKEEISRVCQAAYTYNAATAASRATDTIKTATSTGFIDKTVDRSTVWHAQTPQIFGADLYRAALAVATRDKLEVTDDCSLVEHIEHPIKLVECSSCNVKITTPEDVWRAKAIIRQRNKAATKSEEAK